MPKATIEEKETAPEADPEQPEPAHEVAEELSLIHISEPTRPY